MRTSRRRTTRPPRRRRRETRRRSGERERERRRERRRARRARFRGANDDLAPRSSFEEEVRWGELRCVHRGARLSRPVDPPPAGTFFCSFVAQSLQTRLERLVRRLLEPPHVRDCAGGEARAVVAARLVVPAAVAALEHRDDRASAPRRRDELARRPRSRRVAGRGRPSPCRARATPRRLRAPSKPALMMSRPGPNAQLRQQARRTPRGSPHAP